MTINMRLVAILLLLAAVCLGSGFYVGRASSPVSEPIPEAAPRTKTEAEASSEIYSTYPHVQDAMQRWAAKLGLSVQRAMEGRSIQMMHFPERDCVQFKIELGAVGGVPIYCYRIETSGPSEVPQPTTKLVYEHSDVE
jgi:hypothetical protein